MAANPTSILPAGFTCSPKPVLNPWEQTLYNLCEEYFYLNQKKSNRHPVLSQVRLTDAIEISHTYIQKVQVNAMSFDILITDGQGCPKLVFEADGKYHPNTSTPLDDEAAKALVDPRARQTLLDNIKDEIAALAGISLFRVEVEGTHPHLEVVRAMLDNYPVFSREVGYPTAGGSVVYDTHSYPDARRVLTMEDIELRLVKENWAFPDGWQFVTAYDVRQFHLDQHP